MTKKIAVLGASQGGQTLAACLANRGCAVRLFEHPDFHSNIDPIVANDGCIELVGALNLVGRVAVATTDVRSAIEGADAIMVIVPAFAQSIMLKLAAPYLQDGQVIVLLPGSYGSLEAVITLRELGVRSRVVLAETNSIPFACRCDMPGKVNVFGVKAFMRIAAFPSVHTRFVVSELCDYFPIPLSPAENVIAVGLENFNMLVHCPTAVLNAGWIETAKGNFDFYGQGISESVSRVVVQMDEERRAIGASLGLDLEPFVDWWQRAYPMNQRYSNLHDVVQASTVHTGRGGVAPTSLEARYISEDVPYVLVPTVSLGEVTRTPAPVCEAVVTLASALNDTDYRRNGRTLGRLGLSRMSLDQVQAYLQTGEQFTRDTALHVA